MFTARALAVTGAVWLDADGSGTFDSAFDYAKRVAGPAPDDLPSLLRELAEYDEAVAAQAAGILRRSLGEGFDRTVNPLLDQAAPPVRAGFAKHAAAWNEAVAARQRKPAP